MQNVIKNIIEDEKNLEYYEMTSKNENTWLFP